MQQKPDITVLGAGLVGSLLAICLAQKGHQVGIYEKRQDPRIHPDLEGRSINLALSERGLRTLEMAGLKQKVLADAIPMRGRSVHEVSGKVSFYPYGEEGQVIYSVSRTALNKLLIEEAGENRVPIFFGHKCIAADFAARQLLLNIGSEEKKIKYECLMGADGAFSSLRQAMSDQKKSESSVQFLDYGYKELHIPSVKGKYALDPNALHIWPREEFMLIALPNPGGSFTCTLFLRLSGGNSFDSIHNSDALYLFFKKYFPDVLALMPELQEDFFALPASYMAMVHCDPWLVNGSAALIGDAAHAIVPFFGQGMNAGFEDIKVLMDFLSQHGTIEMALEAYGNSRKQETDAIAALALQNFVEMRDLVLDPAFILRKKIEAKLHEVFPAFASLYALVTFSEHPYSYAQAQGKRQDAMFLEILELDGIHNNWQTKEGWERIVQVFKRYFN